MKPDDRRPGGFSRTRHYLVVVGLATLTLGSLCRLPAVRALPGREPRTQGQIEQLLALGPHQGDCERCHAQHGSSEIVYPLALIGPDDNTLCAGCHTVDWVGGSYPGTSKFTESSHGQDPATVWPGPNPPPRTEALAAGKCLNCHDPHGWSDAAGLTPDLTLAREEALCLACHDGSPARSNVQVDARKAFRHPMIDQSGRHTGPTESAPQDFAVTPINRRHSECVDCHNPHLAQADRTPVAAPAWSATLRGISRLAVQNGPAGSTPAFTFLPGADTLTTPIAEYQLCFKCHSSWTTQPLGQTDLARALNPANPSYHPVEAPGRNPNINPSAFEVGWNAGSLTGCGDCHGSDTGLARGPHGSNYRYILKAPYVASPAPRPMSSNEICFACHAFSVYGDRNSSDTVQRASRFNKPNADKGHAEHVGEENVSCYSCHVTHGATNLPFLLTTGRSPGILNYASTATGGTCVATCHGSESYQVNYAR